MLIAAFVVLGTAVLLGSALAILRVRTDGAAAPPWWFAGLHGIFAIAGLGCLLLALRGPPRGLATGTASFGLMAAVLTVLAALVGGGLLATHLFKRRLPGVVIGVHATLAPSGELKPLPAKSTARSTGSPRS